MCLGRLGNKGQLLLILNSKVTEFYLKHNQPKYKYIPSTHSTDGRARSAEQPNKVQSKKNQSNKPQQNKLSLE